MTAFTIWLFVTTDQGPSPPLLLASFSQILFCTVVSVSVRQLHPISYFYFHLVGIPLSVSASYSGRIQTVLPGKVLALLSASACTSSIQPDQLQVTTCSQISIQFNCAAMLCFIALNSMPYSKQTALQYMLWTAHNGLHCLAGWTHGGVFTSPRGEMTLKTARRTIWLKIASERQVCFLKSCFRDQPTKAICFFIFSDVETPP